MVNKMSLKNICCVLVFLTSWHKDCSSFKEKLIWTETVGLNVDVFVGSLVDSFQSPGFFRSERHSWFSFPVEAGEDRSREHARAGARSPGQPAVETDGQTGGREEVGDDLICPLPKICLFSATSCVLISRSSVYQLTYEFRPSFNTSSSFGCHHAIVSVDSYLTSFFLFVLPD